MAKSIDVFQASSKLLKKALDNILFIRIIKRIKVKEGELSAKVGSNGQRKVMAGKKGVVSATRSATMRKLGLRNAAKVGEPLIFNAYLRKGDRSLLEDYLTERLGYPASKDDLKSVVRGWIRAGLDAVRQKQQHLIVSDKNMERTMSEERVNDLLTKAADDLADGRSLFNQAFLTDNRLSLEEMTELSQVIAELIQSSLTTRQSVINLLGGFNRR